jgi:N-acetylmuramoyl-L-alanine amidase
MRFWLPPLFHAALLAATCALPAHAVTVRAIRLQQIGPDTRLIVDLTGKATQRIMVLGHPDRIVVDLSGVRLQPGAMRSRASAGPVRELRLGRRAPGQLRVVVDLAHPVHAKSLVVALHDREGYRLVIDLVSPAQWSGKPALAAAVTPVAASASAAAATTAVTARPVKASHAPAAARDLVIAVDAGHGGDDPGAIGKNGTREKDVTLAIARELADRIDAEPGMHAVLTRDGDYFVTLRDRMQRARARQADLFLSVHADSAPDRRVDGSSVYILSPRGASDEAARWLAERENAADLIGGVSLDDKDDVLASVLLDLSQSAALSASEAAAEQVLRSLNRVGEVRKREVQQARFVVLKSPDIPSMLVETAYISNPNEEQRLRAPAHQARLAQAILHGLRNYFYANPPAGTRIGQLAAGAAGAEATAATAAAVGAAGAAGGAGT